MPLKIGLLMIRDENDILEDTLSRNAKLVDCFYVLDGSMDAERSYEICGSTGKLAGSALDQELERPVVDGIRDVLLDWACLDYLRTDHWFLLLHGDELWTFDPDEVIAEHPRADGFEFCLPFTFPRSWDDSKSAFEQLDEFMAPGWPEFRMFKGGSGVYFDPAKHFSTTPYGLKNIVRIEDKPILHYLYRSPEQQYAKAARNQEWSPENWQDLDERGPFWDDERIADFCARSEHYTHSESLSGLRLR